MLYRDYSREPGEWVPNAQGGRENLEAIDFLQRMNQVVGVERPGAVTIAEESTSFPGVTRPPGARRPGLPLQVEHGLDERHAGLHRRATRCTASYHHRKITFGLMYALQRELRAAAVARRGGARQGLDDRPHAGRRLAEVRQPARLYGYMWAYPGKKLLFMGCEFAQRAEWNADRASTGTCWSTPPHQGVQRLVRDLNGVYRALPGAARARLRRRGLRVDRCTTTRTQSVFAFVRRARDGALRDRGVQLHAGAAPRLPAGRARGRPLPRDHQHRQRRVRRQRRGQRRRCAQRGRALRMGSAQSIVHDRAAAGDGDVGAGAEPASALQPGSPCPLGATLASGGVNFALCRAARRARSSCACSTQRPARAAAPRAAGADRRRLAWPPAGRAAGTGVRLPRARAVGARSRAIASTRPSCCSTRTRARWSGATAGDGAVRSATTADDPTQPDPRDNAAVALKARVVDDRFAGGAGRRAAHAAGATRALRGARQGPDALHPDVPEALRGTYAGLATRRARRTCSAWASRRSA